MWVYVCLCNFNFFCIILLLNGKRTENWILYIIQFEFRLPFTFTQPVLVQCEYLIHNIYNIFRASSQMTMNIRIICCKITVVLILMQAQSLKQHFRYSRQKLCDFVIHGRKSIEIAPMRIQLYCNFKSLLTIQIIQRYYF